MDHLLAALETRIRRFAESGDPSVVLDPAAVDEAGRLWETTQPADGNLQAVSVSVFTVLAYLHMIRYQVLPEGHGQDDLQLAVGLFGVLAGRAPEQVPGDLRGLLAETQPESPGRAEQLTAKRARAVDDYYKRIARPEVLDVAVTAFQGAVAATPPGHPDRATYFSNLGNALRKRFDRDGDGADVNAAIDAEQLAVAATPPGHPDRAMYLSHLGNSLLTRFEWAGDSKDLEAAIDAGQQAVALTPPNHPNRAGRLSNLGMSIRTRFQQAGNSKDLDFAIDLGQQAVVLTPPDHPNRAMYLSNLGGSLWTRFQQAGNSKDLDFAIDIGQQAVALTPPDHPNHAIYLSNLANSLGSRFERAGDSEDLDSAIDLGQQAIALTPPDHPNRAERLTILGGFLLRRFDWAGDSEDLDSAIDIGQQAMAATPPDHPNRAGHLSNLGNSLLARFEWSGDSEDLDSAIDIGQRAVAATPPAHPNRAMYLSNLGNSLGRRFERAGDGEDLDAAIEAERQAVAATPPEHPERAMYLSNLGNSLLARFERAGDSEDLDAAIDAGQQAMAATPPGHPNRAKYMSNAGGSLLARFERAGDSEDLDAAIDAAQQAMAATPPGHPDHAMYLSNRAASLLARFERAGDSEDLDAAIDAERQAVAATPPGHPDLARHLSSFGISLLARFERGGDSADLDGALGSWQQASQVPTGTPRVQLAAATRWGAVAAGAGRAHEATDGYAVAVGLLPAVAWHGLNRATREEQLGQWVGLAADAAACAVLDDRPELAVELLEQGRSVLWAQALNLRSDLTRLADSAPGLAERLDRIRKILDSPVPEATLLSEPAAGSVPVVGRARQLHDMAELRRRKAREWDDVLAEVRVLTGFEHFLTPIPYAELAAAAVDGPAVIVNASRHGCHALIVAVGSKQARIVNLPNMTLSTAVEHADGLLRALAGADDPKRAFRDREKDRHAIFDVLDWLWDVIAEPVLGALGHTSRPETDDPWPRVWWCPTGPLSLLPIHAAGHHARLRNATTTDCVLDRVISSYTPTLTALIHAHQPLPPAPVRHLTVGMPSTPGLPPLPAVPDELEVVARHFPRGEVNHQLVGSQATRADVLSAIAAHSWVHLACHASQQHADPTSSGFAIWHATLTITDLAGQPTQRRDLAFLSACHTATGSVRYLDEAIHLAAAMQFLGYRHVIATMWTIADPPAPHVADAVYSTLTRGGRPDPERTAEALHQAIHSLRRTDPTNPLRWAPYIYIGI